MYKKNFFVTLIVLQNLSSLVQSQVSRILSSLLGLNIAVTDNDIPQTHDIAIVILQFNSILNFEANNLIVSLVPWIQ